MITTGIIREINLSSANYKNNKYKVELNIFQIPGDTNKDSYTFEANCMVASGFSSVYNVGDKVFVGFLNNDKSYPIILGKIYQGLSDDYRGYGALTDLKVKNSVELPTDFVIGPYNYSDLDTNFKKISLLSIQQINQIITLLASTPLTQTHLKQIQESAEAMKKDLTNSINAAVAQATADINAINTNISTVQGNIADINKQIQNLSETDIATLHSVLNFRGRFESFTDEKFTSITEFKDGDLIIINNHTDGSSNTITNSKWLYMGEEWVLIGGIGAAIADLEESKLNSIAVPDDADSALAIDDSDPNNLEISLKINNSGKNVELSQTGGSLSAQADFSEVIGTADDDKDDDTIYGAKAYAEAYVAEEDKFYTEIKTVNSLGGIAAGVDLNGQTTHEILRMLLYPYVDAIVGNATATPNGGTYEKGETKTITSVSISITKKSEPINKVALYNGASLIAEKTADNVKNGGTITFTNLNVVVPTDGNQLTVKVTYPNAEGADKTIEKQTTALAFVYPYYYGVCDAAAEINAALILGLTKDVSGKGTKTYNYTTEAQRIVIAYPMTYGALKSVIDPNNFEIIDDFTCYERSITGLDGTSQEYYVYVSGACSVTDFKIDFKY